MQFRSTQVALKKQVEEFLHSQGKSSYHILRQKQRITDKCEVPYISAVDQAVGGHQGPRGYMSLNSRKKERKQGVTVGQACTTRQRTVRQHRIMTSRQQFIYDIIQNRYFSTYFDTMTSLFQFIYVLVQNWYFCTHFSTYHQIWNFITKY